MSGLTYKCCKCLLPIQIPAAFINGWTILSYIPKGWGEGYYRDDCGDKNLYCPDCVGRANEPLKMGSNKYG